MVHGQTFRIITLPWEPLPVSSLPHSMGAC
jgi:hypothetical protein